jgi:outer membrane protein
MKLFLIPLILVSSFALATDAPSGTFRVAYVDLQKALQSVEAGKTAKTNLEKDVAAKRTELEKEQAKLQQEAELFEKKAAIMNDSAKAQKQAELQKRFADFQKNAAESQMNLQKRERELTKPLIDELRAIIEALGKEDNYQLILEKNEGAVLYAQAGADLTDVVIGRFNASHKKKKG